MVGFADFTMASCCGPAGLDQTDAVQQRPWWRMPALIWCSATACSTWWTPPPV